MKMTAEPVTISVLHRVKPGLEQEFEDALSEITSAAMAFPGHMGVTVIRSDKKKTTEYRIVFRFDSQENLDRWENSQVRNQWLIRSREFATTEPAIRHITGLETWFVLPGSDVIRPPPRHRMAIVSWLAIYPLIGILLWYLGPVFEPFPFIVRVMIITALSITIMTYGLMPAMTRLFAFWLYPKEQR